MDKGAVAAINESTYSYMRHRIHRILLVCCSYDGYILEEDGHIEQRIKLEYNDLNMSNPPSFTRVGSTAEALELLSKDDSFDFVLTMYNVGQPKVFEFGKMVKELYPELPIALLTSLSKDIYLELYEQDCSGLDYIFCWHGNADLIIAIIKLIEDNLNAEEDINIGGVQAILLIEDSARFYSSYLPELYKIILKQYGEYLSDAYNEKQQILRNRARAKIILATNYDDAINLYNKYKSNLLGVISDVGFIQHRGDHPSQERYDAGIELCRFIKEDNPLLPVLLQSSQLEFQSVAQSLGVGFIAKNSKRLLPQLNEFLAREFAFGELLFINPQTNEEICRAKSLSDLQKLLPTLPDDVFEYYMEHNMLSKWLYARGLSPLASEVKKIVKEQFNSIKEHKETLVKHIKDYRILLGQGVVSLFNSNNYSDVISFARLGRGSLGGKARGLAFMNSLLIKHGLYNKYPNVKVVIPRTIVIATDYFDEFIELNGLGYIISQEMRDEEVLSEFVSSAIPEDLRSKLKSYISTVRSPLAIRSSSKLEDSHYQPFAGIYSTYMIPYVDNEDQMLRMLLKAIKIVYASTYFTTSRAYIASTQNLISEEKMAVVIQQVCGTEQNGYFMPTLSGVARSINCYPIGDELPEEGICNIVMGLGKMVVEGDRSLRFSPSYPQKALQTSTVELALSQTQNRVLALSIQSDDFRASIKDDINLRELLLNDISNFRHAKYVCSKWNRDSGRICDSPYDKGRNVITFNSILKYNSFPLPGIIKDILSLGAEEMRCPVEVEFAVNMDVQRGEDPTFYLLQIRPIINYKEGRSVNWAEIDTCGAILNAKSGLGIGEIEGIRDIIYVKFENFSSLVTRDIATELRQVNDQMQSDGRSYILIGPGRWGSTDPFLGIPVQWRDITEAKMIVECALDGFDIEPSQGTHFFQNVTSLGVGYVSLDTRSGDVLDIERLNRMPAIYDGQYLRCVRFSEQLEVYSDGITNRALVK